MKWGRFVNKLSHRFRSRAGRGEELVVCVDNKSLLSILESAIPKDTGYPHWREKGDAELLVDELARTVKEEGEFFFYQCRECGIPEDLLLGPFEVHRKDGFVVWNVMPPYDDVEYETEEDDALIFNFDERQYTRAIQMIRLSRK